MSAQSPGFSPWQNSPQYTSPVHQYPPYFGPHGLPTPNTTNGSQFPSPASSHASPQSQGYFPPQLSPFINTENPPQSYFEIGHTPCREERFKPPQCQCPHRDDVPYIAPPIEPWMQELQAIDGHRPQKLSGDQIGMLLDSHRFVFANKIQVWRSACSVARPLPSTFFANDEIRPLPPISTLQPGMSVSKYISKENHKEQQSNIRQTPEWPRRMNDPIFHEITSDCARISMEELVRRREQVLKKHTFKTSSILGDDQMMFEDTQAIDRQVQQLEAGKVTPKHRNSISGNPAHSQQFRINQDAVARQHQRSKSWNKHNPREAYISHQPPRAEYNNMPHPKQCYGNKPKPSYTLSPPNSAGRKRARSIESPEDEYTASRRQEIETPKIKKRRESQDTSAYRYVQGNPLKCHLLTF
ncbi:hypothetical protein ASPWEDRAFT_442716 [Aspergillus wentii DTO 134E9]|uniref:Uncharacterized protein n=1 Tax=Aspergillus wentii DTO 134E9 TaxID=1073089 RepID=A0A1L9RQN2_ASPWE|nr:uncharacterized protein ASPWEDRAFT_442716 [Aspergillus wentii DTO 134E9]OJJ37183.1 hypothetical protein ASPWEDRAFT_442716 [Aspergillus wentii DTO 134E9]